MRVEMMVDMKKNAKYAPYATYVPEMRFILSHAHTCPRPTPKNTTITN